jgi:thiamine-phosphate pyrophosphorylase
VTLRLVALTDLSRFPNPARALAPLCKRALPGSVAVVLRDRDAPVRLRLEVGRDLREVTGEAGQALLVSDRVDLALELHADGVHLPADGLLPGEAAALLLGGTVGRSHHGAEDLSEDERAHCSYLLVSPAFAERKGRPALGQAALAARLAKLRALSPGVRLMALGGVDAGRASLALRAGADGVAAISAAHDSVEQLALLDALGLARDAAP